MTLHTSAKLRELAEACPRFQQCAVNNYPLHSLYPDLPVCPSDPERKCRLAKARRLQIVAAHQEMAARLRYGGLTAREHAGRENWRQMGASDRESALYRLSKTAFPAGTMNHTTEEADAPTTGAKTKNHPDPGDNAGVSR